MKRKISLEQVLSRQVSEILPSKKGLEALMKKRKIRVYVGVEPTGPRLHLGHVLPLRKLRQFQDLGHEVILLVGTFTAQVGDPSGRDKMRQPLTPKEIQENIRTYKHQAAKVLDIKKTKICMNGDWLAKLSFQDVLKLASHFTVPRLLERDMFQERMKKGEEVWVHEFMYPLMQGYDSVAMDVDLEIGATDQTFNMLVGRRLQQIYNNKEKFVLTVPMLVGLDGRKMSKTYDNGVYIEDSPKEMYGKLMTLRDELVPQYFELCTDVSEKEVAIFKKKLPPRDFKARLVKEIVIIYHGEKKAQEAEKEFISMFREKKLPSHILAVKIKGKEVAIVDLFLEAKLASSKAEVRRLVSQGGVRIDGKVQTDAQKKICILSGMVLQVGKRRFAKIF